MLIRVWGLNVKLLKLRVESGFDLSYVVYCDCILNYVRSDCCNLYFEVQICDWVFHFDVNKLENDFSLTTMFSRLVRPRDFVRIESQAVKFCIFECLSFCIFENPLPIAY